MAEQCWPGKFTAFTMATYQHVLPGMQANTFAALLNYHDNERHDDHDEFLPNFLLLPNSTR